MLGFIYIFNIKLEITQQYGASKKAQKRAVEEIVVSRRKTNSKNMHSRTIAT